MIDHSQEPYLCSLCKRPIHPTEGALCVVCRHLNRERLAEQREQEHADDLAGIAPLLAAYPSFGVLLTLVRGGLQSDWVDDEEWFAPIFDHATMQTTSDTRALVPTPGWETELGDLLRNLHVTYDTEGHDSWGDWYIGGWWQLPGHDAA